MSIKGKYPESTPLYIGFLTAGIAAAAAAFFIVYPMFSSGKAPEKAPTSSQTSTSAPETEPSSDAYVPDEELSNEMKDEAERLIKQNYTVVKLYYTRGLPHLDEPYGNKPEDGYYTVDSEEYTSLEQLESLVDSTYLKEQAKNVKKDSLGYGPVYAERSDGSLGIIENFTPMSYDLSWDDPTFSISPENSKTCYITLTLHDASGEEVTRTVLMGKTKNGWRLQSVLI